MDLFTDFPEEKTDSNTAEKRHKSPWRVLVVDDDTQVHVVTRLALSGFEFQGRGLELISAYSAKEAREILSNNNDLALALIDVVMETDHAGLDLIRDIRKNYNNKAIRLVLRTGQAGQAPEEVIVREYDIDDYKEKTELTTKKLKTLLYSMLRSYRDLCVIEEQKQGLSKVIQATAKVQNTTSLKSYATSVLNQLTSLLEISTSAFCSIIIPNPSGGPPQALTLAAIGDYVNLYPIYSLSLLPEKIANRCLQAVDNRNNQYYSDAYVIYVGDLTTSTILYINLEQDLDELDKNLLDIFMQNVASTLERINLLADIGETSKEMVLILTNAMEERNQEKGPHVQRVSLICEKLAELYDLPEATINLIKHASPLHDVGKIRVTDSVLNKKETLTDEDWSEIKRHVDYGVDILSYSNHKLIKTAREIAATHHEKWDGSGYPNGLKQEDIPISGRITAIADVFDSMGVETLLQRRLESGTS